MKKILMILSFLLVLTACERLEEKNREMMEIDALKDYNACTEAGDSNCSKYLKIFDI